MTARPQRISLPTRLGPGDPLRPRRTILLTGAAGGVGTLMRELLSPYGYRLRPLDIAPTPDEPHAIIAGLGDRDAPWKATRGVDAIIRLAGIALESSFERVERADIVGTYHLHEAAPERGVSRIVCASSDHAVGPPPGTPPHPQRHTAPSGHLLRAVPVLRRGPRPAPPGTTRPGDGPGTDRLPRARPGLGAGAGRLAQPRGLRGSPPCRTAENVGHTVGYGSSADTRPWWDLSSARALGYQPRDDSERHAAALLAQHGELRPDCPDHAPPGGEFRTDPPMWNPGGGHSQPPTTVTRHDGPTTRTHKHGERSAMGIVSWLVLGLVSGGIAKVLLPGRDPGGVAGTTLIGVLGAFIGGWLSARFLDKPIAKDFGDPQTWLAAVGGALVLLIAYRLLFGHSRRS